MSILFVTVRDFTPNRGDWTPIGNIGSHTRNSNVFTLKLTENNLLLQVSFLSETCFRVRFNPTLGTDYSVENSFAVVNRNLGPVNLTVLEDSSQALIVDTGRMRVHIDLQPYRIRVFRGNQLVNADISSYNLVYLPGQRAIANFKTYPTNAKYCGFGEKAGAQLLKNQFTMTDFNFDNFKYVNAPLPPGNGAGPLNPSEALYASIPFLIENNPAPVGDYQGPPYSYGIFFDNPAQSYFNIGTNDYSTMDGKYYFGALFGDMDYYFLLGDKTADVLYQYTQLTGRSPMPPKYIFGFHQGCYGYYDRAHLEATANAYRAAQIPIDGLHIDVDFQNNYRTFTHSEMKFPNCRQMLDDLHQRGFKCSTNITPLLTDNPLDESGNMTPYQQRQAIMSRGGLIYDTKAGQGQNPNLFVGTVSYGINNRVNPYPYPGRPPNRDGNTPLGADGYYSDYGRQDVREVWGQQYAHLINDLGMDMIWQDMTCPALAGTAETPYKTFPLDLMMNNGVTYVPNAAFHNAYALLLLQATYEGLNKLRPDIRNFIIARGGYAGLQRYAALWTGDSASSWDFLRINIPEVLNLGLSGVPISGCDIGGFATGDVPNGTSSNPEFPGGKVIGGITNFELLTRWMQLGSFLPWYRNHYDGYNKQFQEPYAYGEPVPTNCRKYVELRYRMLQVYYDAMYEWTLSGMPIARALFLNDPDDPEVYNHLDEQFFVGKDFLVAPIVNQSETLRDIYLPAKSQWYAFKDNMAPLDSPVNGGTTVHNYQAGLDTVPIYIRAGAILPMRYLVEQYVGQLPQNPLVINIYPGPDSDYLLYQDDGITTRAANRNEYRTTRISHQGSNGGQQVRLQRLDDKYTPPEEFYYIAFLGTRHPSSVSLGGGQLPEVGSSSALEDSRVNAYYWDQNTAITFIKIIDTQPDVTVTALF